MNIYYYLKNKKILLFTLLIVIIIGIFLFIYSSIIFQEGNPYPQIKGIIQLTFSSQDVVRLSADENKYISKGNNFEAIKSLMKDKGYDFIEQMGSGYLFKSSAGLGATVTHRYYSQYYSIWNIYENEVIEEEYSLVDELNECLPKSDMASHEKCNELLATIRNFDDCVNAGFSIMKSNPPQCATLDGRNFTDETNANWNMLLTALENCEVKSVFQTHSKLVVLKLKTGAEISAYEPKIDDVMKAVADLKGRCGKILLATE